MRIIDSSSDEENNYMNRNGDTNVHVTGFLSAEACWRSGRNDDFNELLNSKNLHHRLKGSYGA
eukprot:5059953-Ditylum_brightwellii.AAC.1